jgi:hypothetical protein
MTDRELEQRLRAWYAAELAETQQAPIELRERIAAIPDSYPAPRRPLARPRDLRLLAVAAILLVGGALAAGAGLVRLPSVVRPAPSDAVLVTPVPSPSATPTATASPPPPPNAWITGQQLADLLSRENGYKWVSADGGDGRTILQLDRPPTSPTSIEISPPFDGRATVAVGVALEPGSATLGPEVDHIAQALAPDAAAWIHDAFAHGLDKTGGGSLAADTANGGSVGVIVVDEVVMKDWAHVWFSPDPLPPVRTEPIAPGSVVYADSGLIRVANPDGTDAGTLLGGAYDARVPGATGVTRVLGWSPDGSRLFYLDAGGRLMSTNAAGSEPTLIGRADRPRDRCTRLSDATLRAKCAADLAGIRELCPALTVDDTCEANLDEVLISPDGARLAYPIDDGSALTVIGFFDIATGQVTRIAFDSERTPGGPACEGPFGGGALQWSPDGTRFVFGNSLRPKVDGWCQGAVFTINADGTDLRRLTSSKVHAMEPRWSPDGSTIVFSRSIPRSARDGKGDATRIKVDADIYSVRQDGSGLTALTSDGVSFEPIWTGDGRIAFRKMQADGRAELWVMDADGTNATRLDTTIAAQSAARCTVCPYDPTEGDSSQDGGPFLRFWRPGQP